MATSRGVEPIANMNPVLSMVCPTNGDGQIADSRSYFQHYSSVLAELPHSKIEQVADRLSQAYEEGRKVFLLGNGASAALASHFACDLCIVMPRDNMQIIEDLQVGVAHALFTVVRHRIWNRDSNVQVAGVDAR